LGENGRALGKGLLSRYSLVHLELLDVPELTAHHLALLLKEALPLGLQASTPIAGALEDLLGLAFSRLGLAFGRTGTFQL
jgi:hypothetical protein